MKDYNERNYYENRRYLRFFSEWQLNLGFSMANFKEIPIEHTKRYGFWRGLWETVLRVLFAPHHFFAKMQPKNSILSKLLFALFCINLDSVITFIIMSTKMMPYSNPALGVGSGFTLVKILLSGFLYTLFIFNLEFIVALLLSAYILKCSGRFFPKLKINFRDSLSFFTYPCVIFLINIVLPSSLSSILFIVYLIYIYIALQYRYNTTSVETNKLFGVSMLGALAYYLLLQIPIFAFFNFFTF